VTEQAKSQSNKPNDHGDDQCAGQMTINIHHWELVTESTTVTRVR